MEGLVAAPWFREFARRDELAIADCTACKRDNSRLIRQHMACGYEPPIEHGPIWSPPSKWVPEPLTCCAGYTVNLPEVTEALVARAHWKHGALAQWLGSDAATEDLMNAIVILDGSCSALESWAVTPSKDGGGAK